MAETQRHLPTGRCHVLHRSPHRLRKVGAGRRRTPPEKIDRAFGDYYLVIADEAHHLRNAGPAQHDAITEIATAGARKDMLLVTATPINNSLRDLEHLLGLFLVSDDALAAKGIASWSRKVRDAIRMEDRDDTVPEGFLYDLLDQVTVAGRGNSSWTTRRGGRHHQRHRRPRAAGPVPGRLFAAAHRMGSPHPRETRRRSHGPPRREPRDQADEDDPALTFARYDLPAFSLDETERSTFGRNWVV